jgi:FkbM family methyltransferase
VEEEIRARTGAGFRMKASPRDYISYSIFFFGDYDRDATQAMRCLVREGDVAFDLGAERGWFTLLLGRIVGPTGQVHAFEAFPATVPKLRDNVALNDMPWIRVNPVGVSKHPGTMHFEPPSAEATQHRDYLQHCGGVGHLTQNPTPAAVEVPVIRLDDYVEETGLRRLDFMKIDIEGAEIDALEGARRTLQRFRPIISIEYNRVTLERVGQRWQRLDELFDEFGYDRFLFQSHMRRFDPDEYGRLSDDEAAQNVYCFPRRVPAQTPQPASATAACTTAAIE